MAQISAPGMAWRTVRGVVAVIGLAACSGGVNTAEAPSNPTQAPDVAALQDAWDLVSLQEAGAAVTSVPEGRFVADFGADQDLYIQADCNVCSAAYRATDAGTVDVVGPVPCTLAWCSSAPLDARYLSLLQSARSWSVGDGTLELSSAEGVLRFTRAR
jgi:heat shock protein HslJ